MNLDKNNIYFSEYRLAIDKRLSEFLAEQTARSHYSGGNGKYPHSLYDPLNYIMSGGGKRIRPLMLIFSSELFGGTLNDSIDAAVAVEILHNFTLVHDDIMDNADSRRGMTTIHKKWSVNEAILVGDELIGLSYRSLLRTKNKRIQEIVKVFTDGVIEVCEGQALDKEYETKDNVNLDDYMIMIKKKTAELLRTSAVIGSIIANADNEKVNIINNYSQNLGIAFQIQDDLLDVTANEDEFGKKIGGDILEKKKTYLYLKSRELLQEEKKAQMLTLFNSEIDKVEKIKKIISIYFEGGAVDSAKEEIKSYTAEANRYLSRLENSAAKQKLQRFSEMLLNRNF